MLTKMMAISSSITLATGLALAGGIVSGSPVHAAGGTKVQASQLCTKNNNAVFGSTVPFSHGACVSTIDSKGRSSTVYASLCRYVVPHGGTLSGIAASQAPHFLDTATTTTINNILKKVTMPSSGKFTTVGQCVSAFNKAKHTVLHASSTTKGYAKGQ